MRNIGAHHIQSTDVVTSLRSAVAGTVIGPGDARFDGARAVWSGLHDRRPAAVVLPRDAGDVAGTVALAARSGVPLAVRGAGHGPAGHGTSEGGIVLDLAPLRGIALDRDGGSVWAGAGLTAGELTAVLGRHGLAVGFGDSAGVGIGGLTLGGGVGYLSRAHGLTIDNLLAADLVTADGRRRRVDHARHPDLFWAIRGGGGNFGVATRFRYRVRAVATVTAGTLAFPATAATLAGFVAAATEAPDTVSAVANVVRGGDGGPIVAITVVHSGRAADAPAALAPFHTLGRAGGGALVPMPYAALLPPGPPERGRLVVGRAVVLDTLDRDAARDLLDHLAGVTDGSPIAQVRVLGGAVGRVPADATAFAHRASPVLTTIGVAFGRRGEAARHRAWAADAVAALGWGDAPAYVNFLGDEGPARVRAAYPGATWDRLRAIKRRYDPRNVFRVNHNIPPAGAP